MSQSQPFNLAPWKDRVAAWWRERAPDWQGAMQRVGAETAYGLLTASAFLPLLEAYSPATPGPAISILSVLTAGVGSNLVANVVQNVYDKATAPQQIEQEIAEEPDLRPEYEQLLTQLDALGAARAALGEQWPAFEAQLRAELSHMGGEINIGGGVVLGDVQVQHGDFVGRDKHEHYHHEYAGARVTQITGTSNVNVGRDVDGDMVMRDKWYIDQRTTLPPGASPQALREAYLSRVYAQTRRLPLSGVDPQLASGDQTDGELQLAAVYTALLTRHADAEQRGLLPEREARQLSALEMLNRERYLVLLGDPGSGKTTFVDFVALCLAGEALGERAANLEVLTTLLPVERSEYLLSSLLDSDEKEETQPQPWDHGVLLPVRVVLRDFVARGLPAPGERVDGGTLWAFIAGELGHAEYEVHLKTTLLEQGGLILLDGLDEVPEANRRREQVKAAVQGFKSNFPKCHVLVTSRTYAYQRQDWKLEGFAEAVLAPFTPGQIERFVDRWYAHVGVLRGWHSEHTQGQAALLKTAIERSARLAELAERPLLLTLMASLHAWRGGSLPEQREELYADAVDLLLDQWEGRKVVRDAQGNAIVRQRSLAEWLKVDRAEVRAELEALAFEAHRDQPQLKGTADVPEERLTGALLKVARDPEARANPLELEAYLCHRAGLLAARGVGVYTFPHRTFQEYLAACYLTDHGFPDDVADLARTDPQRWREATLLAGAKAASGSTFAAWALAEALCYHDPPVEKEGCSVPESDCWGALLASQVLLENEGPRLATVSERHAPKRERVRRWLRAIVERGWLPPVDRAEAGNALAVFGDDRDFDEMIEIPAGPFLMGDDDDDDASPQHVVTLPAYRIAKYPVTVVQFRRFVEDSGYEPEHPGCLQGVANHPVVYVNWYDARAYCEWVTRVWREAGRIGPDEVVRLPSEAEWEKAASWDLPPFFSPPEGLLLPTCRAGLRGEPKRAENMVH